MNNYFESEITRKRWQEIKTLIGQQVQKEKSGETMILNDLLLNIKGTSFNTVVNQSKIQTEQDKEIYNEKGYTINLTEKEFKSKFKINPNYIWYTPSYSLSCFYFNPNTLAVCPFHIELFLIQEENKEKPTFGLNIEDVYHAIEKREQEVANNEYFGSILALTDTMRLEYFKLLIDKKGQNIPNLYHLFISNYNHSDYGFSTIDPEILQIICNSKTEQEKQLTQQKIKDLPDTITVYRGGNSISTSYEKSYSWTLDINIANFFAVRRGNGPAYIAKGQIKKEDIIEYIDDRNEQEVLIDPNKVTILEVIDLKEIDFIKYILPIVSPLYHKYKDLLETLTFAQQSTIHGKDHELRVLLLCLIESEMLKLPMSDRRILATAAIYHDTQRKNDWSEPEHGQNSKNYYHQNTKKPDPIVEFLCEYHCLPDELGYQEIKNNRKLSKNREQTTLLFKIFKDCDGLDRVRLGNIRKEMDLNQYRLPITKQLTLLARICFEQIKL